MCFCLVDSVFYCCMGLLGASSLSHKKLPALKDSMVFRSLDMAQKFNVESKDAVTFTFISTGLHAIMDEVNCTEFTALTNRKLPGSTSLSAQFCENVVNIRFLSQSHCYDTSSYVLLSL